METALLYLGRLLFGGFFINGGLNHFMKLEMMAGYSKSKGVPMPKAAVAFTGLLLVVGGVNVLLNIFPAVGLAALILFLIPVSFMMHAFWNVADPMVKMGETVNFSKNIALLGAVLLLMAHSLAS